MTQNFSSPNLRGRSLKGKDLTGANFSGADIRSSLPPEAQQALLAERGAIIKMLSGLLGSGNTQKPDISITNNIYQNQDNQNTNNHCNINTDGGNYNEDIQGNYVQGDSSEK